MHRRFHRVRQGALTLLAGGWACHPAPRPPDVPLPATAESGDAGPAILRTSTRPTTRAMEVKPAEPEPSQVATPSCWERSFGTALSEPDKAVTVAEIPNDCPECRDLRGGPKLVGLHPSLLRMLARLQHHLSGGRDLAEPLFWVTSGRRDGAANQSMHNQGLAIDLVVCGLDTQGTAKLLREVGFPCVIEYYDEFGKPCHMAHGDLRGSEFADGAYGPSGRKAKTCPKRAQSRGAGCQNSSKSEWQYAAP